MIALVVGLFLIGGVYAYCNYLRNTNIQSVEFYYSPTCPHCQAVYPFVEEMKNKYTDAEWKFIDVTKAEISVEAVPLIVIKTSDGRFVKLVGSYEIPKFLECELKEQSSLECPTTSELNQTTNSYFVR